MSNRSQSNDQDSTNSGHGALGMGGQPTDTPRDLKRGGTGQVDDDRGAGTGPVGGASGSGQGDPVNEGTAEETAGVGGDSAVLHNLDNVDKAKK